ncbi:hypothetical protein ASPCAL13843 [Aspergillus calidoustus]|uniref:Uncharacterized protein n=1 Tax=Aspergillus calidoustus TaxID=454130 RepID=A0A0U5CIM5_ASPCI|nr:hypothetical protein ASPCAL13843 [Aspergillus calidoustus]
MPHRYRRLGGECLYRQTGRRFKGFQKDRKTAALESDINELMVNCADRADGNGISMGTRGNSLAEGDTASENVISQGILDEDTAERYLIIFKTKLIPHFFCGCTPRHICQAVPPEEAIPLLSYPCVSSI